MGLNETFVSTVIRKVAILIATYNPPVKASIAKSSDPPSRASGLTLLAFCTLGLAGVR